MKNYEAITLLQERIELAETEGYAEKIPDYVEALRLAIRALAMDQLPCRKGDRVWVNMIGEVEEATVEGISYYELDNHRKFSVLCCGKKGNDYMFNEGDFGRLIFTEMAEAQRMGMDTCERKEKENGLQELAGREK